MSAKSRTVEVVYAGKNLPALLDDASRGDPIVLEKDGAPVGALLSARDYAFFVQAAAKRDALFAAMEASQAKFADVPAEEIEAEIERAITEIRSEWRTWSVPEADA